MGDPRASPISDDEEKKPAAVLPAAAEWAVDEGPPRPDWLPDGFGMEGYYDEADGKFHALNFYCPVTGIGFSSRKEVLDYCFDGAMNRAIQALDTLNDETTLQGQYAWLRGEHKWLLEIRAGGENKTKMFKVFAHPRSKVRITSEAEVMRLIEEGKLPDESTNDGDCIHTSNRDDIIAQLDFNVSSLPPGWIKEIAFRKYTDGIIRTDRFYTDPMSKKVFRSLKAAEQYFACGEIMDCYEPHKSVTSLYSFDGCIGMPPCLAERLKVDRTKDQCEEQGQTSSSSNPSSQKLTRQVGEDGKEVFHGDSKEKFDEEECHGDDKKEEDKKEALYHDDNEKEDNEKMRHGDGKEDDELGALHGHDKVGVNGEGMPSGDGMEDDEEELLEKRFCSLADVYSVRIEKGNLKRKRKIKNRLV